MTEQEARDLVEHYLDLHNAHRFNEVLDLYADDAVFQLNSGRPSVQGKEEIRKLELFDVYASSHLQPYGLEYEKKDGGWRVHIAGVIEHSRIFSALGMTIVVAQPVRNGFELRGGKIAKIVQPDLNPACTKIALGGFVGLVSWLEETSDYRAATLVTDGRLALKPETIPLIVDALKDWRSASGWKPESEDVRSCATPLFPQN